MSKKVIAIFVAAYFITPYTALAVNWGAWESDVSSDNSHADAVKTNKNLDLVKDNVNQLGNSMQEQTEWNKNQESVNSNQAKTNRQQSSWNQGQESVNEIQADTNQQQSTWNQGQESINAAQTDTNQQQSTWNQGQEGKNARQHGVNQRQVNTNAQVRNNINTLYGDVRRIDNRVDRLDQKMKRGLSAQSALSGLFQPYGIGKANLSLGLGGYDSSNALAIGSGYRFNERVATKVGLSTDTETWSAVSYNAAINFEW